MNDDHDKQDSNRQDSNQQDSNQQNSNQQNSQRDSVDRLDPQDPQRHQMQPPIPTHPPDPGAAGDADKVVGPDKPSTDPNAAPHVNTAIGSGPSFDQVGGAGLGKAPGESRDEHPATTRARDTRAVDQQDRTHES
jgi:hypothetical protein